MQPAMSWNDAAILALLARAPKLRAGKVNRNVANVDDLLASLSSDEARSIALVLMGRAEPSDRKVQGANVTATALAAWAKGLRPTRALKVSPLRKLKEGVAPRPAVERSRSRKATKAPRED